MRLTTTWRLRSRHPSQVAVIRQNMRFSIFSHLLVPGGKRTHWIVNPNSPASFCNSRHHNLTRLPFLTRQLAVINKLREAGSAGKPISRPQHRMRSTANSALSWSMPTLTHPPAARIRFRLTLPFTCGIAESCNSARSAQIVLRETPGALATVLMLPRLRQETPLPP